MSEREIIRKLYAWCWAHCQHAWWCKDSWMIGRCNCGAKEMFDFLESLHPYSRKSP